MNLVLGENHPGLEDQRELGRGSVQDVIIPVMESCVETEEKMEKAARALYWITSTS